MITRMKNEWKAGVPPAFLLLPLLTVGRAQGPNG